MSTPLQYHSKFYHHLIHFICINVRIIPRNTVLSSTQKTTNLSLCHTTNKLSPWSFINIAELYTCLGSVIKKLIITDPECNIPGLIIRPTVVRCISEICLESCGHRGSSHAYITDTLYATPLWYTQRERLSISTHNYQLTGLLRSST